MIGKAVLADTLAPACSQFVVNAPVIGNPQAVKI